MMKLNKVQFDILVYMERRKREGREVNHIVQEIGGSEEEVLSNIEDLLQNNYISLNEVKDVYITTKGTERLEEYRVKRAIFIAAGMGKRLNPLTLNIPKPLVKVGKVAMIETMLEAVCKAGIEEVIIVRGYLKEQFDYLLEKYPHIQFVDNDYYDVYNNIYSAYLVRDKLENAYVMDADLVLSNKDLVQKYEYRSNYIAEYQDYTDDWCFEVEGEKITKVKITGSKCYRMYGFSYWNEEDGKKLNKDIAEAFGTVEGKDKYWDEVSLRLSKDHYTVYIRECRSGDIVEIDTLEELKNINKCQNYTDI